MQFTYIPLTELCPGDIVRIHRVFYWHYGIFCGKGEIIHFTTYPQHFWSSKAEVKKTLLSEFIRSSTKVEVMRQPNEKSHVILANAYRRIGEHGYSLFKNNCLHFALSCIKTI